MKSKNQIFNIAIVALALVFLGLMFVPYFTYNDVNYSINGYIWIYPKVLKPYFSGLIEGYADNNNPQIIAPALALLVGAGMIAVNFVKSDGVENQLISIVWCLIVSIGFPLNAALKLGNMVVYIVLLVLAALIDALVITRFVFWYKAWKADPKHRRRRA